MLTYTYDQFREHPVIRRLIQRNGTVNNYVNEFRKTEKKLLVFWGISTSYYYTANWTNRALSYTD